MSVRRRLDDLERRIGRRADVVVPIILSGIEDDVWRERAERESAIGHRLRIVRLTASDETETLEEAEALIPRHREQGHAIPIEVYRKGSNGSETLAAWDPGLPDWLRGEVTPSVPA